MKTTVKILDKGFLAKLGKVRNCKVLRRTQGTSVTYVTVHGKIKSDVVRTTEGWAFWGDASYGSTLTVVPDELWVTEEEVIRERMPIAFSDDTGFNQEEYETWGNLIAILSVAPLDALKEFFMICDKFSAIAYPDLEEAYKLLLSI